MARPAKPLNNTQVKNAKPKQKNIRFMMEAVYFQRLDQMAQNIGD